MSVLAVIDTNVIVSGLLARGKPTNPNNVLVATVNGKIIPVIHDSILREYVDVLGRTKFNFPHDEIEFVLQRFRKIGIYIESMPTGEHLPDEKDRIFYEVAVRANKERGAYLVTGNTKHFPVRTFIISPAQMMMAI